MDNVQDCDSYMCVLSVHIFSLTELFSAYGIELWGCSKPSNTKIIQTFQSKTLRKLVNAPWYI
jgi:hypothetical protein